MPGKHINDRQFRRYMSLRKEGETQATSAAQAGFSERTARRIDEAPIPPGQARASPRQYRTRRDPFEEVWQSLSLANDLASLPVAFDLYLPEEWIRSAAPRRGSRRP